MTWEAGERPKAEGLRPQPGEESPKAEVLRPKAEASDSDPSPHSGGPPAPDLGLRDRKSTRLNSSHLVISYAVFCLKKKKYSEELMFMIFASAVLERMII